MLGATDPVEAPIPPYATPLSEPGRYECHKTFDETLDFYEKVFHSTGGVRWRNVVNLPGIKAKHIENLRKKAHWEGINVYEYKGKVRVFVIQRPPEPEAAKPAVTQGKSK
jgi:hypothetical protein